MKKEKVEKNAEPRTDYTRIVESIRKISDDARSMRNSGLTREAGLVLLKDATGLSKKDIATVLDATENLVKWCVNIR